MRLANGGASSPRLVARICSSVRHGVTLLELLVALALVALLASIVASSPIRPAQSPATIRATVESACIAAVLNGERQTVYIATAAGRTPVTCYPNGIRIPPTPPVP